MPPADPVTPPTAPDEPAPEARTEAGRYRTEREAFDHSVVALAQGDDCWLESTDGGVRLLVDPDAAERVREQLGRFDRESVDWPPRAVEDPPARPLDLVTPLLWALATIAVFRMQTLHPIWTDAGLLDRAAVFEHGEWWRPFTALWLHADASHLASNLLGGVMAFAALASTFGRRRGWLLLAVASIAGNVAVALAHAGEAYRSLGASTAIFAAIGLLTGRAVAVALANVRAHRWRAFFLPAATGVTVLALQGAGGEQVDVMAHVAGFAAGVVLGGLAWTAAEIRRGGRAISAGDR